MTALRNTMPDAMDSDADAAEGRWSQTEMLLAALVDESRMLRWLYTTANSGDKSPPKQPEPIRRPGVDRKAPRPKITDAQARFLFNHINGLPQDPGVRMTVVDGGG